MGYNTRANSITSKWVKMNEEALKSQTQKRRQIPEEAWAYLRERGYVEDALTKDSDEEAMELIFKERDALFAAFPVRGGGGSRGGNKRADSVEVSLSDLELERKAALEEYLAKSATCDADVYLFREKVLEGELLSKEQAWKLLKSPAAAFLETRLFRDGNIPLVGHIAEVNDYRRELVTQGIRYEASVTVHPPGITQEVSMTTWAGTSDADSRRPVVIGFPDEEGRTSGAEVWSISLLGELRDLSDKLSQRYRWEPAQAVWFVLTGEIPAIVALQAIRAFWSSMYHHDILITIEASPWVSSKTVEKAFRKAQIKTMGTKGGRPPGEKNLRLFRFVTERIEPLGLFEEGTRRAGAPEHMREIELVARQRYMKIPKHKDLVREWNETYPDWSYKNGTSRFWRDYERIKNTVADGPA